MRSGVIRVSQDFILPFRCQIVTFQHSQNGLNLMPSVVWLGQSVMLTDSRPWDHSWNHKSHGGTVILRVERSEEALTWETWEAPLADPTETFFLTCINRIENKHLTYSDWLIIVWLVLHPVVTLQSVSYYLLTGSCKHLFMHSLVDVHPPKMDFELTLMYMKSLYTFATCGTGVNGGVILHSVLLGMWFVKARKGGHW